MSSEGLARQPMRGKHEGPARLVHTNGYSTTAALSTMNHLISTQELRRGSVAGAIMPQSRRNERLFGVDGPGRTKYLSAGIKIENLSADYVARHDTCIKAFVRMMAATAAALPSD